MNNELLLTPNELFNLVISSPTLNQFTDKQLEELKFKTQSLLIDRSVNAELKSVGLPAIGTTDTGNTSLYHRKTE